MGSVANSGKDAEYSVQCNLEMFDETKKKLLFVPLQCVSGEGALNKLLDKVTCQKAYSVYCQETSCDACICFFEEKSKLGDGVLHNRPSMWHWQRLSVPHSSLSAAAQAAAGLWHLVSMACQLKANVPTCPALYVAPFRILTGLSYCVHTEPKATGHLHLRGGAGSASVDNRSAGWVSVRRVWWRWRGEEKKSGSERCPVYLAVNRWRVGGKVETEREKMIKRSCVFLSGYDGNPPSFLYILSQHDWEGEVEIKVESHSILVNEHDILTTI